ncbi:MAG: phosphate regulon sensor histidine kinase PhoR [Rhodospirillaceae bacterium]|nr:phosphate regulon sensor histidine kinase PhoR [Rhodospirillaceae bacterium]
MPSSENAGQGLIMGGPTDPHEQMTEPNTEDTSVTPSLGRPTVLGRAFRWFTLALLPSALILTALITIKRLSMMDAGLAFLSIAGLTALFSLAPLIDLSRLLRFVQDLSQGSSPPTPEMRTQGVAAAAAFALSQMRREMRRSLAASDQSARSLEDVFDALPDAVVMLDTNHCVVRANMAARNLFGRNLTGRDVSSLVRHPPILEALDQIGNGGRELEFSLPIPVERRFIVSIRPLPDELAGNAAILIAFHDITTIRRMEQMRADFVANASHELRTPLSSLIGFIDTLRGPAHDDTEARDRFLGIMAEQAARMARLIEDLLSLSRIELNEHTQPSQEVDIRRVISSVIESLEPKAQARKVTVSVTAPKTLPPVRGEADELTQVFQNLIENAIKYTLAETDITISIAALDRGPVSMPRDTQGPVVAVAVRDHGEGIAQDHIPRLTERFYRVDSARSRKMGGTGLGLAIVKHVMSRHRGVLTIDSSLGQGSIFTAYLPIAQPLSTHSDSPSHRLQQQA